MRRAGVDAIFDVFASGIGTRLAGESGGGGRSFEAVSVWDGEEEEEEEL